MTRHYGVVCPDQTFMCCVCFDKIPVDDAYVEPDGTRIDMCQACGYHNHPVTQVRTMHPYGYHSGQWADILSLDVDDDGRLLWFVAFPNGDVDTWVAGDPLGEYEFRKKPLK
jgi:hypothetical protein